MFFFLCNATVTKRGSSRYLLATPEALGSLCVCFMCSISASPPRNILWQSGQEVAFGPPMSAACCCNRPIHCWQNCALIHRVQSNQSRWPARWSSQRVEKQVNRFFFFIWSEEPKRLVWYELVLTISVSLVRVSVDESIRTWMEFKMCRLSELYIKFYE